MEELDKKHLKDLKRWLTSKVVDDPEELWNEIHTIVALIDFYLTYK